MTRGDIARIAEFLDEMEALMDADEECIFHNKHIEQLLDCRAILAEEQYNVTTRK